MPSYTYLCGNCGRQADRSATIGEALRTTRCEECGGVMRLRIGVGVNISATALETKGGEVRAVDEREDRWHRDMPAYKRMRHKGMQPAQIDGSASLEDKVGDQFDVQYHSLYEQGVTRERVQEGAEQAAEIMAEGIPL